MTQEQKIDSLINSVNRIEKEVQTIGRGVYGDAPNKVKGLIQTDLEQHARIKSLEETRKKVIWSMGGALLVIQIIIKAIEFLL